MVKQYQNTGEDSENTAPTLFEYDSFGNQVKQTLALSDTPIKDNSPIAEMVYSVEQPRMACTALLPRPAIMPKMQR